MAVVQAPLGGTATTNEDDEQPDATGTLASYLKGGPEGAALALMQQQRGAVGAQQQKLLEMMNQQQGPLSQTGMSDLDKASLMFQAAGALGQTTRSGGFGETLGNVATAVAGPLSKAADAQRQRQQQLQQLQLARQKLAVEMTGQQGVPAADMLSLIKEQRARTEAATEEPEKTLITLPSGDQVSGTYKGGKYYDLSGKEINEGYALPKSAVASVGQGIVGEEYLAELSKVDPTLARQVKAVAEGRQAMPSASARNKEESKKLVDAVNQYDPDGASDILNNERRKLVMSFTSGKDAEDVKALNTLIGHLGSLKQSAGDLDNYDLQMVNRIRNKITSESGGSRVTNFNFKKKAVADELSKVLKGTPSEGEVKRWNEAINEAMSPEQLQGVIESAVDLMEGRMKAIGDKYEKGFSYKFKTEGGMKLLDPKSQESLESIKSTPLKGTRAYQEMQERSAQQQTPQAQGGGQPPAAAQPADAAKAAAVRAAMEELARRNAQAGAQ